MKIVWIGAGNLATQLGEALHRAGHETLQVFSRTMASAEALAGRLGCPATDDLDAVVPGADVYIFSVKDGVLEGLVSRIAPRTGDGQARRYGVLYPMQTFSKDCPVDFKEIPVFVEASAPDVLAQTEQLARSVSDRVEEMSTERRRRLHLAAVFACNFVNHCYALAADVLGRDGIPFDVMWPLIDETARKVHRLPPVEAQTGPAVRYDRNVMDRQCAMLDGEPERKALYEMMSRSIHALALRNEAERKETND